MAGALGKFRGLRTNNNQEQPRTTENNREQPRTTREQENQRTRREQQPRKELDVIAARTHDLVDNRGILTLTNRAIQNHLLSCTPFVGPRQCRRRRRPRPSWAACREQKEAEGV